MISPSKHGAQFKSRATPTSASGLRGTGIQTQLPVKWRVWPGQRHAWRALWHCWSMVKLCAPMVASASDTARKWLRDLCELLSQLRDGMRVRDPIRYEPLHSQWAPREGPDPVRDVSHCTASGRWSSLRLKSTGKQEGGPSERGAQTCSGHAVDTITTDALNGGSRADGRGSEPWVRSWRDEAQLHQRPCRGSRLKGSAGGRRNTTVQSRVRR